MGLGHVLIKLRVVTATWIMSALLHLPDSRRTPPEVREVPLGDIPCLGSEHPQFASASSSTFASFRSRVSKPSVNQPYTGASSSRACCDLPLSRQRRAMLIAARSSSDLAF